MDDRLIFALLVLLGVALVWIALISSRRERRGLDELPPEERARAEERARMEIDGDDERLRRFDALESSARRNFRSAESEAAEESAADRSKETSGDTER